MRWASLTLRISCEEFMLYLTSLLGRPTWKVGLHPHAGSLIFTKHGMPTISIGEPNICTFGGYGRHETDLVFSAAFCTSGLQTMTYS